ncbi:MAG: LLM class flavin-dependent oxidoreductase [Candidatus Bathyarchaeia archaeon]
MTRFGVILPTYVSSYELVREVALEAEELGYDSAWLNDHFFPGWLSPELRTTPCLECWTTISALAVETTKLRLGTLVLCNNYRHPPILAKMAATLDVVSGGRLEFGIGAGDLPVEYEAYGLPYPKDSVRIEQLREALEIMKMMWTKEKPSYTGRYYRIRDVPFNPKPIQKPHPRIWVGSITGKRRILSVIAEHADFFNVLAVDPEDYRERMKTLDTLCRKVGRSPEEVERSWFGAVNIFKTEAEADEFLAKNKPEEVSVEEFTRQRIFGTPEQCIEKINRYIKAGATYFIANLALYEKPKTLKLFAEEVIRVFKE